MTRISGVLAVILFLLAPTSIHAEGATALTVPLIKQEYPGNPPNIRMVHVRVLSVGEHRVDFPLLFDTGSAGMTIDCQLVLPATLCSHDGIKIDREVELDGIRVTSQRIVSRYGIYDEYGNLAFARVAFGDPAQPAITSKQIPILIRYKNVRRATGEIAEGPLWPRGMFGVSPIGSQADGELSSPMESVEVPEGMRHGFYLSPIGEDWSTCMNEFDECPSVDALHIGVDETLRAQFEIVPLAAAKSEHFMPFVDTCVIWPEGKSCHPAIFDTGNSTIMVPMTSRASSTSALPPDRPITVNAPKGVSWSFVTRYTPEVEFAPDTDINLIGIRFLETNSLLFDLERKEIGFRIGW